jgi:hypothetical protein
LAQRLGQSLRMGAATGGRPMLTEDITIPTQRPTAEVIIMADMVIIMRHLITIPPQEPTAGNRLPMGLTARLHAGPLTILTPERTREAHRSPRLTGAEAPRKRITRTPEHTLRRDKVRIRMLSGVARMSPEETRALPWAITRLPTEP